MHNIRKPALTPLAAALATLLAFPALAETSADAAATAAAAEREPTDLDSIEVQAQRLKKAASPKYTEDLVDTPQTITVVTKEVDGPARPAAAARRADHPAWHHLRRRRRRRRLWRQHQPARLQRQQRHHHRRRPRQRAVHAQRHLQPRIAGTGQRRQLGLFRRGLGRGQHQPGDQDRAGRRFRRGDARRRHRQLRPHHLRRQPRLRQRHRLPHQRHGPPERRAGPRFREVRALGHRALAGIRPGFRHALDAELPAPGRRQHAAIRRSLLPQRVQRRPIAGRRHQQLLRLPQHRQAGHRGRHADRRVRARLQRRHLAAQPGAVPESGPGVAGRCDAGHLVPRQQPDADGHVVRRWLGRRSRHGSRGPVPAERPARLHARHQQRHRDQPDRPDHAFLHGSGRSTRW